MTVNSHPYPHTVSAIVVLYFPDAALLARLLDSVQSEIEHIVVVDNTPADELPWLSESWFMKNKYNVIYQSLGDNYGIAKAQNVGIERAIALGTDHVILFDQDSAIPAGMLQTLITAEQALLQEGVNVGSVGPLFLDEKNGLYAKAIQQGSFGLQEINISPTETQPVQAEHLIASGSLIRTDVLQKVGLMREELFIDWVDIEWSLRANQSGYYHYIIPQAVMQHSIGDESVEIGQKTVSLHSDLRHFYFLRNACYLLLHTHLNTPWRLHIATRIPRFFILFTLTSSTKLTSFKRLVRACILGFTGHLGKASL